MEDETEQKIERAIYSSWHQYYTYTKWVELDVLRVLGEKKVYAL